MAFAIATLIYSLFSVQQKVGTPYRGTKLGIWTEVSAPAASIETCSYWCCWQKDTMALLMKSVVSTGRFSAYVDPFFTTVGERESGSECVDLTTVVNSVILRDVGLKGENVKTLHEPCNMRGVVGDGTHTPVP